MTSFSSGTTLRWKLRVQHSATSELQNHLTFAAWEGQCGTGTPIPDAGIGDLAPNEIIDVCVRFSLSPTAPASLQNRDFAASITMIAEQATS
ncbi:hypothetical protein ACFWHT_09190 [Microbacterium sp. NPDC058342]|uniref:hypothetical protein n=1 Tax=Microbacterium sp. NPDC058342 TaxID=3346454 RepID=UPI00365EFC3E